MGGRYKRYTVTYAIASRLLQPTTLGEIDGSITPRLRRVAAAFRDAGFPVAVERNMEAWQKTHVCWILPLAAALYMAGTSPASLAGGSDILRLMLRSIRECFAALHALGVPVTPSKLRVFEWMPERLMLKILGFGMTMTDMDILAALHVRNAPGEMRLLADTLLSLVRASGASAVALEEILAHVPGGKGARARHRRRRAFCRRADVPRVRSFSAIHHDPSPVMQTAPVAQARGAPRRRIRATARSARRSIIPEIFPACRHCPQNDLRFSRPSLHQWFSACAPPHRRYGTHTIPPLQWIKVHPMANDNACLSERETFIASGCLQCAGNEESCCAESYVPLTIADIDAILELGHTLEEATQAGEYYEEYLDDAEPWWRASMTEIEGRLFRVTTRKNERAQCVFLREGEGCLLGANRPRVCKIYPFWVDESGAIIVEPGEEECCNIAAGAVRSSTASA